MRTPLSLFAGALLMTAGGCSSIQLLQFSPDTENSGITKGQQVTVSYVRGAVDEGVCRDDPKKCFDTTKAGIPAEVMDRCMPSGERTLAALPLLPFIVAGGQMAFDFVVGAIDSRRAALKEAAVKRYGATAITPDLVLGAGGSGAPECVITQRFVPDKENEKEKRLAMTAVSYLKRHVQKDGTGKAAVTGLTWVPAYLRVDLAAAQTGKVSEGRPKIGLTQALSIAAIQPDPKTKGEAVELVSTSSFEFSGVEIGALYVNPEVVGDIDPWPKEWSRLTVPEGPLFVPLRHAPTVGAVSVAVIEKGLAASLGDVSDAEKAMRASLRGAIGKGLEETFKE